jgi:riboflavin transporter FmnP
MNTKTLALTIIFTALTIAINIAGPKIPAPYAPFLQYQLWEIPIVIGFIFIGIKEGLFISVVNALVLLVYNPGPILMGPFYNLLAVLSMMVGFFIPYKLAMRGYTLESIRLMAKQRVTLLIVSTTVLAIAVRVAVMSVTNYFALPQAAPIGLSVPLPGTIAILPLIAAFNASVVAYTIPMGLGIAIAIITRFRTNFYGTQK